MIRKALTIITLSLFIGCSTTSQSSEEVVVPHTYLFDIDTFDYNVDTHKVDKGDTWGKILENHGIGSRLVSDLTNITKEFCPLNKIVFNNTYHTFSTKDSIASHLDYLVYEKNKIDYVVFSFKNDSVSAWEGHKHVTIKRQKKSAKIGSSLWGAILREHMPAELASEMEDIYQWTIDFFGIQSEDSFTVIYDEKIIDDSVHVGIGRVWGAKFNHGGKEIYAIPYPIDGKIKYWEKDGASLRKQLLKAPLKFTRISSTFSNARFHPVLKVYKPHHGVDYAAPAGTPVRAVADGTVTEKAYKGAGGNTIKIKHPGNLQSGYLHLKGYAKGLKVGKHVSQGEIIGYVGSTGRSTGPHLDFRLWKNGQPINPLKVPQQPAIPIPAKEKEKFEWVRDRVIAELEGEVADSLKIIQLDSIVIK